MNIIEIKNMTKKFGDHTIFNNYSLDIQEGDFVGIKGNSGKGKTTLLNIIGLLEPFEGELIIKNNKIKYKDSKQKKELLKNTIGYLFQNFALVDDLTVYDNLKIALPKINNDNAKESIIKALKEVGLDESYIKKKIYTCSGGEQQRIAIARTMLKQCEIILADEPTGSLDEENKKIVMNLISKLNSDGKTVVLVSHDDMSLSYCRHVINL